MRRNETLCQYLRYTATTALLVAVLALVNLSQTACNREETPPPTDQPADGLLPKLSDYGMFEGNLADMKPAARVLPYELAVPLFTDYALKARFVYIPEGKTATYVADGMFEYPDGTVMFKHFYYDNDFRNPNLGRRILETRVLVRKNNAWHAATYLWNDSQTDAVLNKPGTIIPVSWIHSDGSQRAINYVVPSKNDCKGCHEIGLKLTPIGPKALHLNRDYSYATGTTNQITYWQQMGYLVGAPDAASLTRLPLWTHTADGTLEQRARAYLDVNCAHCHNPQGPANNSGLDLRFSNTDNYTLGFCKTPVAAGTGTGGRKHDIVPGDPDASIMVFRFAATTPGISMPELGRATVHAEGLQLIRDWISSLPPDNCQ